jgi:APA family basic amino acid/polyamine antiporter
MSMTTDRPATPAGDGPGLFTRQASGLVRELGVPAAVGISLASVAIAGFFLLITAGLTSFSMADLYLPFLFTAGLWIVAMYAYRYLVEAIPRAGGEYVYLSRAVAPVAGSVMGIALAVVYTYTVAANAHIVASFAPFFLTALGSAVHSTVIANSAADVTSKTAVLLISCGVMLVIGAVSIFSLKHMARILLGMFLVAVLGVVLVMFLLADHSHAAFVTAFDRYSGHSTAYQSLIHLGKTQGLVYGIGFGAMVGLIPLTVEGYNGVLFSNYFAGELRRPGRTYLYASAITIGTLTVIGLVLWALLRHTVGLHFMQAQETLGGSDPTGYAKVTGLDPSTGGLGYGLVLAGDPVTKILFGLAMPMSMLGSGLAVAAATTRVLFALAFDRLVPVSVAKVSSRNHAPIVASAIVFVVGTGFAILTTYADLSSILGLLALFFALILVAGGLAAACLAHRRPDLVLKPGQTHVARWFGMPRSTWAGGATVVLGSFTAVLVVVHSDVYGRFTVQSIVTLAVVLFSGPVIYVIARAVRRQRNQIDLSMAMRELPPE